jgi:CRISPR/Cas system-associated exonuclease Cas4 (RecB family)
MYVIRASEIGTYLYCRRAWWYRRQGIKSDNLAGIQAGTQLHLRHGWQVMAAGLLRILAVILLIASLVLFAAYCTLLVTG